MTILKNVLKTHSIMVDGNVQQGNVKKKMLLSSTVI